MPLMMVFTMSPGPLYHANMLVTVMLLTLINTGCGLTYVDMCRSSAISGIRSSQQVSLRTPGYPGWFSPKRCQCSVSADATTTVDVDIILHESDTNELCQPQLGVEFQPQPVIFKCPATGSHATISSTLQRNRLAVFTIDNQDTEYIKVLFTIRASDPTVNFSVECDSAVAGLGVWTQNYDPSGSYKSGDTGSMTAAIVAGIVIPVVVIIVVVIIIIVVCKRKKSKSSRKHLDLSSLGISTNPNGKANGGSPVENSSFEKQEHSWAEYNGDSGTPASSSRTASLEELDNRLRTIISKPQDEVPLQNGDILGARQLPLGFINMAYSDLGSSPKLGNSMENEPLQLNPQNLIPGGRKLKSPSNQPVQNQKVNGLEILSGNHRNSAASPNQVALNHSQSSTSYEGHSRDDSQLSIQNHPNPRNSRDSKGTGWLPGHSNTQSPVHSHSHSSSSFEDHSRDDSRSSVQNHSHARRPRGSQGSPPSPVHRHSTKRTVYASRQSGGSKRPSSRAMNVPTNGRPPTGQRMVPGSYKRNQTPKASSSPVDETVDSAYHEMPSPCASPSLPKRSRRSIGSPENISSISNTSDMLMRHHLSDSGINDSSTGPENELSKSFPEKKVRFHTGLVTKPKKTRHSFPIYRQPYYDWETEMPAPKHGTFAGGKNANPKSLLKKTAKNYESRSLDDIQYHNIKKSRPKPQISLDNINPQTSLDIVDNIPNGIIPYNGSVPRDIQMDSQKDNPKDVPQDFVSTVALPTPVRKAYTPKRKRPHSLPMESQTHVNLAFASSVDDTEV